MGFKLGTARQPYTVNGEVRTKLRFDRESGDPDLSVPGTPIIKKRLEPGIMGEANMDGSIYISDKIQPGSWDEKITINHEMRHATDIKIGKLKYADDHIKYNGVTYPRQNIQGQDMILVEGNWLPAGYPNFPWEHDANNGNPV